MTAQTAVSPVQEAATGRGYFWGAIAVFALGLVAAANQFGVVKLLFVPWYVPAATTIAAVLLLLSIAQRRTVARIIVFVLLTAIAGFEWFVLTTFIKLPDYEGPARAGAKLPAFQTLRADGRAFTDKDLQDGTSRVLVFFRGRWWLICMIELGQLDKEHAEFDKRKVSVVVISIENLADAKETQKDFPHLVVVSDAQRKLSDAVEVIHKQSAPDGGDTSAPTTILVDGSGAVRSLFRPDRVMRRLSPDEVLTAVKEHLQPK